MGLTVLGTNAMTLTASNGFTGSTTVSSGTLVLANTGGVGWEHSNRTAPGSLVFSSSVTSHAFTLGGLGGSGNLGLQDNATVPIALTVGGNNGNSTYAGVLSSPGALTKVGTGLLTLIGSNTYSGNTTVSGGTLQVGDGSAGHDGSLASMSLSLSNNAALFYNLSGSETYGGAVRGTGSLSKTGTGSLILSGVNNYSERHNGQRWRTGGLEHWRFFPTTASARRSWSAATQC